MDPGPFFTSEIESTAIVLYCSSQTNIIFHTIRLILCFQQAGEIDNPTVTLGQSTLIVLCRFHGRRNPWCCAALHSVTNNLHVFLDSYWFDKPWFLTEGKLAAVYIIPSSPTSAALFLAPLPGRSRHAARGVSHFQSLYFVFVLLYFILYTALFAFLLSKYKKLVTCIYFI